MDGVTILSTMTQYTYGFEWNTTCSIVVYIGVLLILSGIVMTIGTNKNISIWIEVILSITVALVFIFSFHKTGSYLIYRVTVDDSVSLVEFSERYEILHLEGKIWTVKDRVESE